MMDIIPSDLDNHLDPEILPLLKRYIKYTAMQAGLEGIFVNKTK